jgi:DNA repair exonuclease SbcCD nuclease subunit
VPIVWARSRYGLLFKSIQEAYIKNKCDKLIIGGDIFDKIPTLEELVLFMQFLGKFEGKILLYDGNHEATKKGETFLSLIESMFPKNVSFVDYFLHTSDFDILPYCKLHKWEGGEGKLLFTHVRGEIPPHVKPEVDLDIFNNYKLVIAGDLHAHSNSQRNIVYPGSPVTTTFHRNEVVTGCIVVDSDTVNWEFIKFQLPQLIRQTVNSASEMIKTEFNHTIYELVADVIDLTKVENSDLLDKKISTSTSQATLDLKNLSIVEELALYCEKILQLDESKIENIIKVYNDNIKNIDLG